MAVSPVVLPFTFGTQSAATPVPASDFDANFNALANTINQLVAQGTSGVSLLQTQNVTSVATVDFTSGFFDFTGCEYLFVVHGMVPATNAATLGIRISTDGGATWKAGVTDYFWDLNTLSSAASNTPTAAEGATTLMVTGALSNNVGCALTGEVKCFAPWQGQLSNFTWQLGAYDLTHNYSFTGTGFYNSGTAFNGVRFIYSAGNVARANISLFRVAR